MQGGVIAPERCCISPILQTLVSVLPLLLSRFLFPFPKARVKTSEPAKLLCHAGWWLLGPHHLGTRWGKGSGRASCCLRKRGSMSPDTALILSGAIQGQAPLASPVHTCCVVQGK